MLKQLGILFLLFTAPALGMHTTQRGLHPDLFANLDPERLSDSEIAILNEHHTTMQPLLLIARQRKIHELGLPQNVKPRPSWYHIHSHVFSEFVEIFARSSHEELMQDTTAANLRSFLVHGPLQPHTQRLMGAVHAYQSHVISLEEYRANLETIRRALMRSIHR